MARIIKESDNPPPPPTHLVARSKRTRFRRGGIEFTNQWQAFPLSSIPTEKLRAIEAQDDEIDSRRVTEAEARALVAGKPIDDGGPSRAELVQAIEARDARIRDLEGQNAELTQRLQSDRPPKGVGAPGSVPPLPTPGITQVGPGLAPVAPPQGDEKRTPPPLPDAK
jgi:hypothetical protein